MPSTPSQIARRNQAGLLLGAVLFIASISASAEPRTIIGLPPQVVENMPGVMSLFVMPDASAPPRILDEPFRQGEMIARFRYELSDAEVLDIARRAGAHRVVRKSPIGLFFIEGP